MKCNYDNWITPVVKSVTLRMRACLAVLAQPRGGPEQETFSRAALLRAAGIDPNPRTPMGYAGNERTDYYLYKKGLIECVKVEAGQKYFRITEAGLKEYYRIP